MHLTNEGLSYILVFVFEAQYRHQADDAPAQELQPEVRDALSRTNKQKGYMKVRKIIKVLARKAAGLNRKEKVQEMKKGLSALGLVAMRQRRDGFGFPYISFDDLNAVDQILKRASVRR